MGFLDFFNGSTEGRVSVSKQEMQAAHLTMKKLDDIFYNSPILTSLNGRNQVMHSRMLSYRCMLAFIYEHDYKYGSYSEFIGPSEIDHFALVLTSLIDKSNHDQAIAELPTNWKDVEQVIFALKMEPSEDAAKLLALSSELENLKVVLQKISAHRS